MVGDWQEIDVVDVFVMLLICNKFVCCYLILNLLSVLHRLRNKSHIV